MLTENIATLKINKISQEKYDEKKNAGTLNENEFYMTPDQNELDTSTFLRVTDAGSAIDTNPINANQLEGKTANDFVQKTEVIDNLTTADTTKVLSAAQGKVLNDSKASLNSPTFTGTPKVSANTTYTTAQLRNVILSTAAPSGGGNGDIWIKYKAQGDTKNMTQKFEVPYNFDVSLIDKLLQYKQHIDFIYMPSYFEDGENSRKDLFLKKSVPVIWNSYVSHVNRIKEHFDIGVLIQKGSTIEMIDKYYSLGIKIFIINDSNLAIKIKEKYDDVRCILSITSVLTLEDIKNNDYSMYDEIVLFFNFCRQIHLLKELPMEYKYVLIINSHCVYNCNRCLAHWDLKANNEEEYLIEVNKIIEGYCSGIYREDRAFVQPNDLIYFNEYISNYKLVDRLMSTEDIIYDIDRYSKTYEETKKDISWYMIGGEKIMATYDLTTTTPSTIRKGDIINCPYSNSAKNLELPEGVYKLEVWGAQGGYRTSSAYGGMGGYSVGTLTLTAKTRVYLYAGGAGNSAPGTATIKVGGFNGGGYRYNYNGGGGGSDIRIGSNSLYARVIVAGGGGSDGQATKNGMYGGGTTGGSSTQSFGSYGYGGTQTGNAGGASYITTTQPTTGGTSSTNVYSGFGFGGMGTYKTSGYAGAGGGGWYGGTGSYPDGSGDDDRGGGGGSGYIYTSSTAASYPSGCLLNSTHYLASASTVAGNTSFTSPTGAAETGHSGNGYCRITVIEAKGLAGNVNIGGTWKEMDNMYVNIGGTWKEVESISCNINGTWKENG